nr:hypothetical protein [Tanacetum cinerariifolium]
MSSLGASSVGPSTPPGYSSRPPTPPSYFSGPSTPPGYSSRPPTPPSYFSGPSTPPNYSLGSSRNAECLNSNSLQEMENSNITKEEYTQLMPDKARRRGQTFNLKTATYAYPGEQIRRIDFQYGF